VPSSYSRLAGPPEGLGAEVGLCRASPRSLDGKAAKTFPVRTFDSLCVGGTGTKTLFHSRQARECGALVARTRIQERLGRAGDVSTRQCAAFRLDKASPW